MKIQGEIILCYRSEKTGREVPVRWQNNLHMYEAADIMGQILGGNGLYAPNAMYFEYQNTNSAPIDAPTLTRAYGRSYFNTITGLTPDFHDWLRVPIINNPRVTANPAGGNYASNAVTFNATSAASATMLGQSPAQNYFASSGANGPSKIFAVYLVSAPVMADSTQDKVFSGVILSTALTMQPGQQLTVYWLQKFN